MKPASCDAALAAVRHLAPVGLAELNARAALQERVDTKFIVFPAVLDRLLTHVGDSMEVLEIEGRRQFGYDSTYFDSPTWRTYRDHVQQRRRRFKARTRTYVDSSLCMFEVKLEGARGTTAKHRTPHPVEAAHCLTRGARAELDRILAEQSIAPVDDLVAATTTAYRRVTLTGADRPIRITIDADLVCTSDRGTVRGLDDRVLLEVKTRTERDPVLRVLQRLGARPVSVSKYCAGVALLNPELPRAPWASTLRRHFPMAAHPHRGELAGCAPTTAIRWHSLPK